MNERPAGGCRTAIVGTAQFDSPQRLTVNRKHTSYKMSTANLIVIDMSMQDAVITGNASALYEWN